MTADTDRLWEVMQAYRRESREDHGRLAQSLTAVRQDLAALKVKAGIWGLIAGGIPATIVLVITKLL